jgi:hypothetical protein
LRVACYVGGGSTFSLGGPPVLVSVIVVYE